MKAIRFLSGIACLWLAVGFCATTDDRIPAVTTGSVNGWSWVDTITQDQPNNTAFVSAFSYDAQGRVRLTGK